MKYVDLGLSVLWADCNIGANSPEEYGDYFEWNDIPKEYEIPTKEQQDELREKCTWKWTTRNGVYGHKVTSKINGNSIFLPAAGCHYNKGIYGVGSDSNYWSSSLYYSDSAYYLYLDSDNVECNSSLNSYKQSVRSIKTKTNFKNKTTMTLKEVNEIFPLKSGMCLELFKDNKKERLILFQYGDGKLCSTNYDEKSSWTSFFEYETIYDTIKVYQTPTGISLFDKSDLIFNSDDYKVKELTIQEIADKFGVKVENLRIKE